MIEVALKPRASRSGKPKRPRVLAIFSYRYDHHLVPDLIANIEPFVDGWIAYDDRSGTEPFSNEPARRRALVEKALELKAKWILAIDPDERFEHGLADRIHGLIKRPAPTAYTFNLRELYALDRYRIDGVWGQKRLSRLLSLHDEMRLDFAALHSRWHHMHPEYRIIDTQLNLYHLKMIAPVRRQGRRDLYNALDKDRAFQSLGYDYLADETGALFEAIPTGREFYPAHREDGGLWMPKVPVW